MAWPPGARVRDPKLRGPVVIMRGGACDGWAYYEAEAKSRVEAVEATGHGAWRYRPTGETEPYPLDETVTCTVWREP